MVHMGMARGAFSVMRRTLGQLVRYGVVGLVSNGIGYLLYLGITATGVGPKLAMTILYVIGVMQSFLFNKGWSFRYSGKIGPSFLRYCTAYAIGYFVNLVILLVAVDYIGWPHQIVQGVAVLLLALLLFALQKYWVFRPIQDRISASRSPL